MTTTSVSDGAGAGEGGSAGGAAATAGAGAAAAAGAGAGAADLPFYEAFTDDAVKTSPSVQRYKTVEELAKGYVQLETRFGVDPSRRIDLPADPNDTAAMRGVWSRLGLPEKPEGYGLTLPETATEADKAMMGKFTALAHEKGMPADFAKAAVTFWQSEAAAQVAAHAASMEAQRVAGEAALKTELGTAYEARIGEIAKLVEKYDPQGELGVTPADFALAPGFVKFMAKLADRMAEPGAPGGAGTDAAAADRPLSPAQAKAAVTRLESDPLKSKALHDPAHAMHDAVVKERSALLRMADGRQPA